MIYNFYDYIKVFRNNVVEVVTCKFADLFQLPTYLLITNWSNVNVKVDCK